MIIPTLFATEIIDNQTLRTINMQSVAEVGDWQFIQLGHYTETSPWAVNQGFTAKLEFQEEDISYTAGNGLEVNYDYVEQVFRPPQINDAYFSELRFKVKCSRQNGYADVRADVPTFAFNPIQGQSLGLPRASGVEQFVTLNGGLFIGQEAVDNGFEINFTAGSGDFEVYDISILTCRIGSGLSSIEV